MEKTPETQATKAKIDKWDHIKLRNFYTAKETLSKLTGWEKIFANHETDKRLISRINKKFEKLNNNKTNVKNVNKCAKDLNRHFSKEKIQMPNRQMKKC